MKTIQPFQKTKTSVLPVMIILTSLFVAFVFTYDFFVAYQSKNDELVTAQTEQANAIKLLDNLNKVKAESLAGKSEMQKYIQEFREDVIYDKVFTTVGTDGKIGAITINPGETLSSGLTLSDIQFNLDVENLSNLLSFLDRATSVNEKQRFLIKSLIFPYSSSNTSLISASITLGMYTIK